MKLLIKNGIDVNRKSFIYGVPALAYAGKFYEMYIGSGEIIFQIH